MSDKPSWKPVSLLALLLLFWFPISLDLFLGQSMTILAALLLLSYILLEKEHRQIHGGIVLALVISLKLIAWPLFIYLLLKKRWIASIVVVSTVLVANLASAFFIDFDSIITYYLKTQSLTLPNYQTYSYNLSIFTLGPRLFIGTGSPTAVGVTAPPLVAAPEFASFFSLIIGIIFICGIFFIALKTTQFDTGFGIVTAASIILSPVTWGHYFTWLMLPAAIGFSRLRSQSFPNKGTIFFSIALLLVAFNTDVNAKALLSLLNNTSPSVNMELFLPFTSGMLTLAPILSVFVIIAYMVYLEIITAQEAIEQEKNISMN